MATERVCSDLNADGYSGEDVVYNWAAQEDPVKKYKDITMSQFTLTGIETGRRSTGSNHGRLITSHVLRSVAYQPLKDLGKDSIDFRAV